MREASKILNGKRKRPRLKVESYLDKESGEVIAADRLTVREVAASFSEYVKGEGFVKYFYANINVMKELGFPIWIANEHLLADILQKMTYAHEGQTISITKRDKEKWTRELKVSDSTVNRYLDDLITCGFILRICRGLYMANPYLFGKGSDMDIASLRSKVTVIGRNETYQLPPRVEYHD